MHTRTKNQLINTILKSFQILACISFQWSTSKRYRLQSWLSQMERYTFTRWRTSSSRRLDPFKVTSWRPSGALMKSIWPWPPTVEICIFSLQTLTSCMSAQLMMEIAQRKELISAKLRFRGEVIAQSFRSITKQQMGLSV